MNSRFALRPIVLGIVPSHRPVVDYCTTFIYFA